MSIFELMFIIVVLPAAFVAYSWYRHVLERENLALLRETNAWRAREDPFSALQNTGIGGDEWSGDRLRPIRRSARTCDGESTLRTGGQPWGHTARTPLPRSTST